MATLYTLNSLDGSLFILDSSAGGVSTFATMREATASGGISTSSSRSNITFVGNMPGRGGGTLVIQRNYYAFNTSGITGTVASVDFEIYGYGTGTGRHIGVKSTAFGGDGASSLSTGDWDAISGWDHDAEAEGNVTDYTTVYNAASGADGWTASGYNSFTGTSALKTDMQNEDVVIICLMNYNYDYKYESGVTLPSSGTIESIIGYYTEQSGTSNDPRLNYTLGAAGYANTVKGVAAANIGKVMGVATANISKVNGI